MAYNVYVPSTLLAEWQVAGTEATPPHVLSLVYFTSSLGALILWTGRLFLPYITISCPSLSLPIVIFFP